MSDHVDSRNADPPAEGYATLSVLENEAPNYNAWLGRRVAEHLGSRVLEVGAGIGTITREILAGRQVVIALEADPTYAQSLRAMFQGEPRVRVIQAAVENTDWDALRNEKLDTVLLSNVLEHIEDDKAAIANFRRCLHPGGALVLLVPALPAIFGSLDEAVGHFRRYMPASLRKVIEDNGFAVQRVDWINLLGVPGWYLNGRILRRRVLPARQVRAYDRIAPLLATVESVFRVPFGLSLLAVAKAI